MTADEKLKELGWELVREDGLFIIYEWKNKYKIKYQIVFCLERKYIELSGYGMFGTPFVRLKRNDLKAIDKKMEELGWDI